MTRAGRAGVLRFVGHDAAPDEPSVRSRATGGGDAGAVGGGSSVAGGVGRKGVGESVRSTTLLGSVSGGSPVRWLKVSLSIFEPRFDSAATIGTRSTWPPNVGKTSSHPRKRDVVPDPGATLPFFGG